MRVFIGLVEIAGFYANLKKGFDEIGVRCTYINLSDHPFEYGGHTPNVLVNLLRFTASRRQSADHSHPIFAVLWKVTYRSLKVILFAWALATHDVFMFGFNSSFFASYGDLPILKLARKRIIYTFFGSDARPPYLDGSVMALDRGITLDQCLELTRVKKRNLKIIERYADVIVDHPYDGYFHERPLVSTTHIGIPYQRYVSSLQNCRPLSSRIRALHAPSHPEPKGTLMIRRAVANLHAKGYPIDLIGIIGKPNDAVINELASCDFVVDQLYSHALMAGFATEAATFAKPAIVGGYDQDAVRQAYPNGMIPPVHQCHPDDIEAAIETLITDKDYRTSLGMQAKQFVETKWLARRVAERYLQLAEGDIPNDWLFDPKDIRYLYGWGLSEGRVKQLIRGMVEKGGKEALQLGDKPELERMFLEFAYAETTYSIFAVLVGGVEA